MYVVLVELAILAAQGHFAESQSDPTPQIVCEIDAALRLDSSEALVAVADHELLGARVVISLATGTLVDGPFTNRIPPNGGQGRRKPEVAYYAVDVFLAEEKGAIFVYPGLEPGLDKMYAFVGSYTFSANCRRSVGKGQPRSSEPGARISDASAQEPPNKALQQKLDPASRLAVAKRQSASSSAELGR